jgi:hypothetical protein
MLPVCDRIIPPPFHLVLSMLPVYNRAITPTFVSMKKIMIGLVTASFALVIFFIAKTAIHFFKAANKPKSGAELAYIDYYKKHDKSIGQPFLVDSLTYTINGFDFYTKKDTVILTVDIDIDNTTNHSKLFTDSFFILKGDAEKIFYPARTPFTVFEKKLQKLKLLYYLPERRLPYLLYHLHIISQTDSAQNGLITLHKSYRAEG